MIATSTIPIVRTRLRICNHVTGKTMTAETARDRADVLVDLMHLVRRVNRRRDDTIKGCLRIGCDLIVLHWHCPYSYGNEFAREMLEVGAPIHEVEEILWKGGQSQ